MTAITQFELTAVQEAAMAMFARPEVVHCMAYGGSRSGKTFMFVRAIILRALKAPMSRHAILRFRFNHIKSSVIFDTFPKVMRICFPEIKFKLSKTDWFAQFPNGSEIWFGGLDDKERTEKILGQEYATIYLNEASQITDEARGMAITRLAQLVKTGAGDSEYLVLRMFYDCNPTNKMHWTYKRFIQKVDPETKISLSAPEQYAYCKMNPEDNLVNLAGNYMETLGALPARLRKRFRDGDFADSTPNALFTDEIIELWRATGEDIPEFVRISIGVDPSGAGETDNAANDAIGIAVVGLGIDGNAYILEDLTVKAGPKTWGNVVTTAFDRHEANTVVGEVNYGGAMVNFVIQTQRPGTPFKSVTASRGKHIRAEPFSALYETGKIRHVGHFVELEEELVHFSTSGYVGTGSPNRADAVFWALADLFPALVRPPRSKRSEEPEENYVRVNDWMG
jgi:hypothetical protein